MKESEIRKAVEESKTLSEVTEKLGCTGSFNNVRRYIKKFNIDITHFDSSYKNRQRVKYKQITKICPICKDEFVTKNNKRERTYCSQTCANKLSLGNRHSIRTHEKISNTLKLPEEERVQYRHICVYCGKEFILLRKNNKRKYCSNECRNKDPVYRKKLSDSAQERVRNGTHQGWISRNILSYPEKYFKAVFENNGFKNKFITNYPIKKRDIGIDNSACYFLDFYFPDKNIDVEIDGSQHERKEHKIHDQFRDSKLKEHGYKIYRIKWKNPIKYKEYLDGEIQNILNVLI